MNAPSIKHLPRMAIPFLSDSIRTYTLVVVVLAGLTPISLHAAGPSGNKHHRRASQSRSTTSTKSCTLQNCTATLAMFPILKMPCPGNGSCTYQVHVNAQTHVSSMDNGFFRFVVDNPVNSASGTDPNGYVSWTNADPDAGIIAWDARSYTVVVEVSNTAQDQLHSIQIFFGCTDSDSSGSCDASTGFSSMTADVYTPEFP